ncbi:MAG: TonB-dependent receptor [Bacteroidales bacterium]|nr:TonB-dependent receptor [Bacteroidales bacterium]
MLKRFILVALACLIGVQVFAQTTVTGKVVDAKGEPVIGAGVQIKDSAIGVATDLDGLFSIHVADNATLVISSIGYKTVEVAVRGQKTLNIVLEEDTLFLDDVVVVGYGTARKRDVSGAIASVNYGNDSNVASLPNPNALSALSSKVAGLSYAPTTSAAGDNTQTMTIRGKNSIPTGGSMSASAQSVNQPLLVIDGVLSYGSINSINTADIESIDVLKDASAAAIYGSRAANGVIIITTKRGTGGSPVVNFNGQVSISDWSRMPEMVSDKETFLKNRFYSKQGAKNVDYKDKSWSDFASLNDAANFTGMLGARELEAWNDGQWVNWLDEISRKGVGQKYDLSVSGGSERVNYYFSTDYTRQQGIRKGDDYEKLGAMLKMDFKVTDWLSLGAKANILASNSWGQSASIRYAMWYTPLSYVYARQKGFENWYNSHPDNNTASPFIGSGKDDSYAYTDRQSKSINLNGVAYAQVDFPFIPGLSYKITLQAQRNAGYSDVYNKPEMSVSTEDITQMQNPMQYIGSVTGSISSSNYVAWNIDQILTWNRDFGRHHVDATVGYTREATNSNSLGANFTGYPTPTTLGVYNIEAANSVTEPYRNRVETQAVGYLARVNYNFANKYYITGNFRRDGFSAFAPGNKWGNFYGASAAWVLSNEQFIKNLNFFDFLKLRLSWGQNGSRNVSAGATQATISKNTSNNGAITMTWLGDISTLGMTLTNLPNRSLTWATVEKMNLGIDFSFLQNRINGSIDLYTGRTTNMLVARSAPYLSGFNNVNDNVGLVTNKGVEVTLNTVNINGNGDNTFRWESNFVFDTNENKLVSLFGPDYNGNEADDVANAQTYGRESYYALMVGRPLGAAYDLKLLGIFQNQAEIDAHKVQPDAEPGDLKFEDFDGDGDIDSDDRQYIGSPDPLFTLNFGNTLRWKNFSLFFNFRWAQGDKDHFIGLDPYAFGTNMGGGAQLARVKPWTKDNPSQTFPRYGYTNTLEYQYWNSRTYLKLKDLVFSYTIPSKVLKNTGISNLRCYVAATDLFTITNWSGLDPETGGTIAAGAGSSRFGSNGAYKTFTFGVNLTFSAPSRK